MKHNHQQLAGWFAQDVETFLLEGILFLDQIPQPQIF